MIFQDRTGNSCLQLASLHYFSLSWTKNQLKAKAEETHFPPRVIPDKTPTLPEESLHFPGCATRDYPVYRCDLGYYLDSPAPAAVTAAAKAHL